MPPPPKFKTLAQQGKGFAVFPDAHIFDTPGKGANQHLLFGDHISPPLDDDGRRLKWTVDLLKEVDGVWWLQARSRQQNGWMKLDDIQTDRILEVNFVDIGQGDGCHLVTPDDCHFIIDAGKGDNMYRFMRWRFNLNKPGRKLPKFYALISHCDDDHWKGFELLLSKLAPDLQSTINFERLYHQGILQRHGSTLGATTKENGETYLVDFMETEKSMKQMLKLPGKKSTYEDLLIGALENFPKLKLETVWKDLKKEKIIYEDDKLKLEVLGPVPERINGKRYLRWFDPGVKAIGKTKNGHSVILMAHIGKMKILLGGDLNSKSADFLMEQYSGKDIRALKKKMAKATGLKLEQLQQEIDDIIQTCREFFGADVAKSCHHGSHDITNELLQTINPIATVISSGDEESHCHPRPETLGAIGKYGRGERPLIYSTELSRSSPEFIKLKAKDIEENAPVESNKPATDQRRQKIVSTYGMITLRTDGFNAVLSQKLEKNRRTPDGRLIKWQIDKLVWNNEREEFATMK